LAEDDSGVPPQIEILIIAPRFQLGQIVATPGALQALERAGESEATFLARHALVGAGPNAEERAPTVVAAAPATTTTTASARILMSAT